MTSRLTRSLLSLTVATGVCASVLTMVPAAAGAASVPVRPAATPQALERVQPGPPVVITAGPSKGRSTVPAPDLRAAPAGRSFLTAPGAESSADLATSDIIVRYTGFTPEAEAAF